MFTNTRRGSHQALSAPTATGTGPAGHRRSEVVDSASSRRNNHRAGQRYGILGRRWRPLGVGTVGALVAAFAAVMLAVGTPRMMSNSMSNFIPHSSGPQSGASASSHSGHSSLGSHSSARVPQIAGANPSNLGTPEVGDDTGSVGMPTAPAATPASPMLMSEAPAMAG
jgi:hypothetical protein